MNAPPLMSDQHFSAVPIEGIYFLFLHFIHKMLDIKPTWDKLYSNEPPPNALMSNLNDPLFYFHLNFARNLSRSFIIVSILSSLVPQVSNCTNCNPFGKIIQRITLAKVFHISIGKPTIQEELITEWSQYYMIDSRTLAKVATLFLANSCNAMEGGDRCIF